MSEQLEPCPFCGGVASFDRIGDHRKSCIVICENCGCTLESNEEGEHCGAQWNNRRTPAMPEDEAQYDEALNIAREYIEDWPRKNIVDKQARSVALACLSAIHKHLIALRSRQSSTVAGDVRRFHHCDEGDYCTGMREEPEGEWVKYADLAACTATAGVPDYCCPDCGCNFYIDNGVAIKKHSGPSPQGEDDSDIDLRNLIEGIPIMPEAEVTAYGDDNFAIALATYFSDRHDCPEDDVDDELGWSKWAMEHTHSLADRIAQELRARLAASAKDDGEMREGR